MSIERMIAKIGSVGTRMLLVLAFVFVAGWVAPEALAQPTPDPYGMEVANSVGLATTDIRTLVGNVINGFLGLLGLIAVALIIYAGFLWMTAQGDEAQVAKAKALLRNAIIGLVIIMLSFAIAAFVLRAIQGATTGGSVTCPPGQVCAGPGDGLVGSASGGFRVTGTMPAGAGPSNGGWPKNYAITVSFNAPLDAATATPQNVVVRPCNARIGVTGTAQAFDSAQCGAAVSGTLTVDGSSLRFKPSGSPEEDPTDFQGENWYVIRLQSGALRDTTGRILVCPLQTSDVSTGAASDYCERAVAFNDLRDVEPPEVTIGAPSSPPAYCASETVRTAPVMADANDDFLVAVVDFLLDGAADHLLGPDGVPVATAPNADLATPFKSSSIFVDLAALTPGTHTVTAVAKDGVPQSSAVASREFRVNPGSCCNAVQDEGETGVDCGAASMCGSCSGDVCAADADCASGYCDQATKRCAERPFIQGMNPVSGGVGTLVTVTGTGFGSTGGNVIFLGGDQDGDGDPEGDADDVPASACASQAWTATQVVVPVPAGAVTGPIKLVTSTGPSDRSDDASGPVIGSFTVNDQTRPGICYIAPSSGIPGAKFFIRGAGFSETVASQAYLGPYALNQADCEAGSQECGVSEGLMWVVAPPVAENAYNVTVAAGGRVSNPATFVLRSTAGVVRPRVTAVIPESGPVGSYVTIQGSGFGRAKGKVQFLFGPENDPDIAYAEETVCSDTWFDDHIVVKVPARYGAGAGDALNASVAGIAHRVRVETAAPTFASNGDVAFRVTTGPARPGVCSIEPNNGPPGSPVVVRGEGFGPGEAATISLPRYSVEFYKAAAKHCSNAPTVPCTDVGRQCDPIGNGVCKFDSVSSELYGEWSESSIPTVVPGDADDKATWPASGPVFVQSGLQISANAVPFTVQDCNEAPEACAVGTSCCANGSCQESCGPVNRDSAYGWRFSTSVLPTLPQVRVRTQCSIDGEDTVFQTPSPAEGTVNACSNSATYVEFTRPLDKASFTGSVTMRECGSADPANCEGGALVPLGPMEFDCDSLDDTNCTAMRVAPATSYNGATGQLKKNTWYRVTLLSRPGEGAGLREKGLGRFLDGDFDRRAGGDFVLTFKTRNADGPCEFSAVAVMPSKSLIETDEESKLHRAALIEGQTCQMLRCDSTQPVEIKWTADDEYLSLDEAATPACAQPVFGVTETPPGAPAELVLSARPTATAGLSPVAKGSAAVTVSFADPKVVAVAPANGCEGACVNAAIFADFNIPMDPATLTSANVSLHKCRNASCNPPFLPGLDGATTAVSAKILPGDEVGYRRVSISLNGSALLQPNTYYAVRLRGVNGVRSRSGVPLTGLNDGQFYTWTFRTKNDAAACAPARVEVLAPRTVVQTEGSRVPLAATPYGSPDECAEAGQALDATKHDWTWDIDPARPNGAVQGFMNGLAPFTPPADLTKRVDTKPAPAPGCDARCTLAGSQTALPQCGDGVVDQDFEECDDKNNIDNDACTNRCVLRGNTEAQGCGNGGDPETGKGEQCEKVNGAFPPGCKAPDVAADGFPTNIGCVLLGSSETYRSVCGNGTLEEGEACDDGNAGNGDGCGKTCLFEGSLRSCVDVPAGEACTNRCGNDRVEPGEEAACEPNPAAAGCDQQRCVRKGTPACPNGGTNCCGNKQQNVGEDPGCDTAAGVAPHCTSSCVLAGSSSSYDQPSFCGDGAAGAGEHAACEVGSGDGNVDARQLVRVMQQPGATSNTFVRAYVPGMIASGYGSAEIVLDKPCAGMSQGDGDAVCQGLAVPGESLSCATDGRCVPTPNLLTIEPSSYAACRNAVVRVVFDQLMDQASLSAAFKVGYDNGTAACPEGTEEVLPLRQVAQGFWSRVWTSIKGFIDRYIISPVFGAPPAGPNAQEQQRRYCSVKGNVTVDTVEMEGVSRSRIEFRPERAMPALSYIAVRIGPEAKSVGGASVDPSGNGIVRFFGTRQDVCTVKAVQVLPQSILLESVDAETVVTASAQAENGDDIVPTLDYAWSWSWTAVDQTHPVVLLPREASGEMCVLGYVCGAESCSCAGRIGSCTVPQNGESCVVQGFAQTDTATVRVRGAKTTDAPSGVLPRNSEQETPIEAIAHVPDVEPGTFTSVSSLATCGTSTDLPCSGAATVLLCENPWPQKRSCVNGFMTVPWDPAGGQRQCQTDTWLPFTDTATNTSYSYCRDVQGAGDVVATLPCLKETVTRITRPTGAQGVLHEYLFTMETDPAKCPKGPSPLVGGAAASWVDDAIGHRVAVNPLHVSAPEWYRAAGFRGTPTPTTVDGYSGLQEGRTVYVNAAAKTADNSLYTNVNVFSHSDGASPETVAIFNQVLRTVDFNATPDMRDVSVCATADGSRYLACDTDDDCRVDAAGAVVAGRDFTCDVSKHKCMDGDRVVEGVGRGISCTHDLQCPERVSADETCANIKARLQESYYWNTGICGQFGALKNQGPAVGQCQGVMLRLSQTKTYRHPSCTGYDGMISDRVFCTEAEAIAAGFTKASNCPAGPFDFATEKPSICVAPKSKLIRDVRRWADLSTLRTALADGAPLVEAGSFLRGQSTSVWGSWTGTFASQLGATPPTDPVNRHGDCAVRCTLSAACDTETGCACTVDADTCTVAEGARSCFMEDAIDPVTCWDEDTKTYANPPRSHVYTYSTIGGGRYSVGSVFEFGEGFTPKPVWKGGTCGELTSKTACQANPLCSSTCTGASAGRLCTADADCGAGSTCNGACTFKAGDLAIRSFAGPFPAVPVNTVAIGGTPRCGDGVLSTGEECEAGATRAASCSATVDGRSYTGSRTQSCGADCKWAAPVAPCQVGSCGDGIVQPGEICDDGSRNGIYGFCAAGCGAQGDSCGDAVRQPSESCDCGNKNGNYAKNGILASGTAAQCAAAGATGANAQNCAWNCLAPGPSCGDGVKDDVEQCDGGFEEFKGYCNDSAKTGCNSDAQCPALGLCQGGRCSNDNLISCGSDIECLPHCGSFCPTGTQVRRRYCQENDPTTTGDDANACNWSGWVCTPPGVCGNGIKEAGEQCDDGNTNNTDGCIIDGISGMMCVLPRCGDKIVSSSVASRAVGVDEQCDDGPGLNGAVCTPGYDDVCAFCGNSCQVDSRTGPYCGDGQWYPGEEDCDGAQGDATKRNKTYCLAADGVRKTAICTEDCGFTCPSGSTRCTSTSTADFDGDGLPNDCDRDDDDDDDNDDDFGGGDCADRNRFVNSKDWVNEASADTALGDPQEAAVCGTITGTRTLRIPYPFKCVGGPDNGDACTGDNDCGGSGVCQGTMSTARTNWINQNCESPTDEMTGYVSKAWTCQWGNASTYYLSQSNCHIGSGCAVGAYGCTNARYAYDSSCRATFSTTEQNNCKGCTYTSKFYIGGSPTNMDWPLGDMRFFDGRDGVAERWYNYTEAGLDDRFWSDTPICTTTRRDYDPFTVQPTDNTCQSKKDDFTCFNDDANDAGAENVDPGDRRGADQCYNSCYLNEDGSKATNQNAGDVCDDGKDNDCNGAADGDDDSCGPPPLL